ncbi:MAG: RICIN domain-containing protein, partial [Coriobacteriia bacterium]|nr:RICIN domain-containing protein [Coriobacteriia bacterium]
MNAYCRLHVSFAVFVSVLMLVVCAVFAPLAWAEETASDVPVEDATPVVAGNDGEVAAASDDAEGVAVGQRETPTPATEQEANNGAAAQPDVVDAELDLEAEQPSSEGLATEESVQPAEDDAAETAADTAETSPVTPDEPEPVVSSAQEAGEAPAAVSGQKPRKSQRQASTAEKDPARIISDGVYWMVAYANTKQAVAMPKNTTKSGAQASLAKKAKRTPWQKWVFIWRDGSYEIVNALSGKALAAKSTESGSKVVQAKRANYKSQRWVLVRSSNGKYIVIRNAKTGLVLNVAGKVKAGAKLLAATPAKKYQQRFVLRKTNLLDAGAYSLITKLNASQAAAVAKKASGWKAALAKKGSSLAQRFYVRNEAGGLYSMQSVSSGLFLADVG